MKQYKRALSIAGFDGSGGAGIQADLKIFSALGCYGMTVLTSLPIQNTTGVKAIYDLPVKAIVEQLQAIISDIGADVIKIGMLHKSEIIKALYDELRKYPDIPIVIDPVIFAKSGDRLLEEQALHNLKKYILPISTVITPNLYEAQHLANMEIKSKGDMISATHKIAQYGSKYVVIKGGHLKEEVNCWDLLFCNESKKIDWFENERIKTKNLHGTGCTFSSAIATNIAYNMTINEAVRKAKEYIFQAILHGAEYKTGQGAGPVHHFYNLWGSNENH